MSLHKDMNSSGLRPSAFANTHRGRDPDSVSTGKEESVRTTPFTKKGRGEIVDDSSSVRSMTAEEDDSFITPEKNQYHNLVTSGNEIYSPSVYDQPQTGNTAGEECEPSDGQKYEYRTEDQKEDIEGSLEQELKKLEYFCGKTTYGGHAPPPPDPEYKNTETLEEQLKSECAGLHLHVDNSMRSLGKQVEKHSNYSMDQILKGVEGILENTGALNSALRSQCEAVLDIRPLLQDTKGHLSVLQAQCRNIEPRLRATFCEENAKLRKEIHDLITAYMKSKPPFPPPYPGSLSRQMTDEDFLHSRQISFEDEIRSAPASRESSKEDSKESSTSSRPTSRQNSIDVFRPVIEKERPERQVKSKKSHKELKTNVNASGRSVSENVQKDSKESTRWEGPKRALRQMKSKTSMSNLNKRAQNKVAPSVEEGIPPVPSLQQLPPAMPAPTSPLPPVPSRPLEQPRSSSASSSANTVVHKPSRGNRVTPGYLHQQRLFSDADTIVHNKPSSGNHFQPGPLRPPRPIPAPSSTDTIVPNKHSRGNPLAPGTLQQPRSFSASSSADTTASNKHSPKTPRPVGQLQQPRSISASSSADTIVPHKPSPETPQRAGHSQIPKPSNKAIGEFAQTYAPRVSHDTHEARRPGTPTGTMDTPRTPAKRDRRAGIFNLGRKKEGENVKPGYNAQRPFIPDVVPSAGRPSTPRGGSGNAPAPVGPPPSRPPPIPPVNPNILMPGGLRLDPRVGQLQPPRQYYSSNVKTPTRGSPVERSRWS